MPRYLLRFDDAHQEMNVENWSRLERICDEYNIKPIVAVIPDNKDTDICFSAYDRNFWTKVRGWQAKKWLIAMHGYQHVLKQTNKGIVPINNYSEFTGLSEEIQSDMIVKGLSILNKNQIIPTAWIAPAHGMDHTTLVSLYKVSKIRLISDGFSFRPYRKYNFNWMPQQLWRGRKMLAGFWTICLHPSSMTLEQVNDIEKFIVENHDLFISTYQLEYSKFSFFDSIFSKFFILFIAIKRLVRYVK
jgi:predicted deacetylase